MRELQRHPWLGVVLLLVTLITVMITVVIIHPELWVVGCVVVVASIAVFLHSVIGGT